MSLTWILGPPAFLVALPLVRRLEWFWAEIPGHVRERAIGHSEWIWEAGAGKKPLDTRPADALPIRVFIFTPFIALVLVMVGATAIVALRSADDDSDRLATRFQQEAAANIGMRLDKYRALPTTPAQRRDDLARLLSSQAISADGRAFILDRTGIIDRFVGSRGRPDRVEMRFWLWRLRPVRDCPEMRRSSASITSQPNRRLAKHGWPTRRRTMAETDPGFW